MITVTQVIVGVAMGFILQMVFGAMVVAGQTLATSMGLGFAAAVDPQNGVQVPVVSQYFLDSRDTCFPRVKWPSRAD